MKPTWPEKEQTQLLATFTTFWRIIRTHSNFILIIMLAKTRITFFMFYFLWRVITGREMSITISFMVTGHTKFSCDRYFGLRKEVQMIQD